MGTPGVDLPVIGRLRHRLHARPELSGREEETALAMAEFFAGCSPARILTGLGGHGVAAVFQAAPGPTVLLRAELDALPIAEDDSLAWHSIHPGIAHKCGHDGHLAILAGVARSLAWDSPPRGRVILLCQPAEETGRGAAAVAADPLLAEITPDHLFALHNLPGYPAGQVLVREGPFAAGSIGLTIELEGRTAHAAYPEQGNSPAAALSQLVTGLSSLPIPLEKAGRLALVTVTHAQLGRPTFGVTPGQAEILATLRADRDQVLEEIKARAETLVEKVARTHDLAVTIRWSEEFPVTRNHPEAVAAVRAAADRIGLDCAEPTESPFRWSEDFGHLLALGPGALFGLGSGREHPSLHSHCYDFNDGILAPGIALLDRIVRDILA